MLKKVLTILCSFLIIFAVSASAEISPENPSLKSYSACEKAPEWMQKQFREDPSGNFGLLDWFGFVEEGRQYHLIQVDNKASDGILDGICDDIVIMQETSPEKVIVLGTAPCETWKQMVDDIQQILEDNREKAKRADGI